MKIFTFAISHPMTSILIAFLVTVFMFIAQDAESINNLFLDKTTEVVSDNDQMEYIVDGISGDVDTSNNPFIGR